VESEALRTVVDGRATGHGEGWDPAVTTYGHFTAMQVRHRRTRGMDLHLDRLRLATEELFGADLDEDLVRRSIRLALGDNTADASVCVYVIHTEDGPSTIVTVKPPVEAPVSERLRSVLYQRPLAHLKHLGGFRLGGLDAQSYFRERVRAEGFDEALFTASDGTIAEAAIANVGFVSESTVVWPDAPALPGITMQLIQRELTRIGRPWHRERIRLADLDKYDGAFLTNSRGTWPVTAIDERKLSIDERWFVPLAAAYESVAWDEI
jgi:branched-subunit amino acid aminotransferase/4-amino-4-deoxychorismate lyase